MRTIRLLAIVAALGVTGCGDLNVPNLNAPSVEALGPDASRSGIAAAVQGLLAGTRTSATAIVATLGAYGREGMNLDPSNPQGAANTYQLLDQDAWSGTWLNSYRNMAQANLILASLPGVAAPTLTDAEKEGIRGFAKTFKAIDLFQIIIALDVSGAALDAPATLDGALPPIATRAQVYTQVLALLDEARVHLQAAGTTPFAFSLPAGFTGFNTPATFLQFNRAYRARVNVINGDHAAALTDLAASFINPAAPLTLGVYHNFSTNSGDAANTLYDPTTHQRFAHPSIWAGAQLKLDGTRDNRALAKVAPIAPLTRTGFTVSEKMTVYNGNDAPIAIIRNEELFLLRAEARLQTGDRTGALADINFIRTTSGGLAPIADPGDPGLLNELLYNRVYSLYWEQGARWIDARRYGRLTQLPHDRTGDVVFTHLAIPRTECDARTPRPAGCTVAAGV